MVAGKKLPKNWLKKGSASIYSDLINQSRERVFPKLESGFFLKLHSRAANKLKKNGIFNVGNLTAKNIYDILGVSYRIALKGELSRLAVAEDLTGEKLLIQAKKNLLAFGIKKNRSPTTPKFPKKTRSKKNSKKKLKRNSKK